MPVKSVLKSRRRGGSWSYTQSFVGEADCNLTATTLEWRQMDVSRRRTICLKLSLDVLNSYEFSGSLTRKSARLKSSLAPLSINRKPW